MSTWGRLLLCCVVAGILPFSARGQEQQDSKKPADGATQDSKIYTCKREKDTDPFVDVVFLNARPDERKTCVVNINDANSGYTCKDGEDGFLVQGKRNQFCVVNRKFFTDYSLNIDGVTQLKQVAIQDLEEAANLQLSTPSLAAAATKGAAPKGLSTSGQLALRTAQDLLAELIDPGRASNPAKELESDRVVVAAEVRKVTAEQGSLQETWKVIYGDETSVTDDKSGDKTSRDCQGSFGAPNLTAASACLETTSAREKKDFPPKQNPSEEKYGDEDLFRALTVEIGDRIIMINALSTALQQNSAAMLTQLSALDSDLTQLQADMNTLRGNQAAANDAITAYCNLREETKGKTLTELRRAQIKLKLMQDLNGGTKATLDDAELNRLVDLYLNSADKLGRNISDDQRDNLDREAKTIEKDLGEWDGKVTTAADADKNSHENLGEKLPGKVDAINVAQSKILARANEIYDHSAVPEPLDKIIDLSKNSGNLLVYYTVRRVDVFPRYTVPVITLQGSAAPIPPVTPPTGTPATTTTTTTTGQNTSVGTVVAHGSFAVHDFYRATVVAAFTFSTIRDQSVKSRAITTGQANDGSTCSSASPCSQPYLEKGSPIPSVVVGVNYYLSPKGHDTFPSAKHSIGQRLGIFGGVSTTKLNSYLVGLGVEPTEAIQLTFGAHFVQQDSISGLYSTNQVYPGSTSFGGKTVWTKGAYFGAGFNLSIFRKIFGSVTGLGTKAAAAGN